MKPEAPHIALVKLSAMGDVIHALAAAHFVRRVSKEARLTWIVQEEIAPLLRELPWLDEIVTYDRRRGWRGMLSLRRELQKRRALVPFHLALDFQGNTKSGLVARFTAAPRRIGLHPEDTRERTNGFFQTERVPTPSSGHVIERSLALAGFALGIAPPSLVEVPWNEVLALRPYELEAAAAQEPFREPPDELVLIHVTPRADVRSWPLERYAELARRLVESSVQVHVLFLGGPGEREESTWLAEHARHPRIHHRIEHRGLRDLLAIHALVRALPRHVVVGTDCGPMQAALAVGTRTVFLHGPQDPDRTGPWRASDVRLTSSDPLVCRPCRSRRCSHPSGPICLRNVPVDDVLRAVVRLLATPADLDPRFANTESRRED